MDNKDRSALIRRGNELYNNGDFKNALKIFLATEYQDGIVRVADHLYYEDENTIGAIKLYKKAGYQRKIDEFAEKAAVTIQAWLAEDKEKMAVPVPQEKLSPEEKEAEKAFQKWEPVTLKSTEIMQAKIEKNDIDQAFRKKKREKR